MPLPITSSAEALQRAKNIADQHGVISSADQTCLFYRYWPPTGAASSSRVVIVLHGIGYYSGPYRVIADALNPLGIGVYAMDARGHGLSCGKRSYVGTASQVEEDVSAMVRMVRERQPSAEIILLGESMGGALALNWAKDHDHEIAGLVLLAPALGVSGDQLYRWGNLCLLPYLLFARRYPAIDLAGKRLEESSRLPSFIQSRRSDPLAYQKVSFGYLLDIHHMTSGWRSKIAPRVKTPMLIIQGAEDRIVSKPYVAQFAKLSASPDKSLKIFPEVRHTTLWDPDTPKILKLISEWVLAH